MIKSNKDTTNSSSSHLKMFTSPGGFVAEEFVQFVEESGRHQCSVCGKDFSLRHQAKRHVLSLHSGVQQQVKCTICGKDFKNKESLGSHKRTSHGIYRDSYSFK